VPTKNITVTHFKALSGAQDHSLQKRNKSRLDSSSGVKPSVTLRQRMRRVNKLLTHSGRASISNII